jgi:hypothetical protein
MATAMRAAALSLSARLLLLLLLPGGALAARSMLGGHFLSPVTSQSADAERLECDTIKGINSWAFSYHEAAALVGRRNAGEPVTIYGGASGNFSGCGVPVPMNLLTSQSFQTTASMWFTKAGESPWVVSGQSSGKEEFGGFHISFSLHFRPIAGAGGGFLGYKGRLSAQGEARPGRAFALVLQPNATAKGGNTDGASNDLCFRDMQNAIGVVLEWPRTLTSTPRLRILPSNDKTATWVDPNLDLNSLVPGGWAWNDQREHYFSITYSTRTVPPTLVVVVDNTVQTSVEIDLAAIFDNSDVYWGFAGCDSDTSGQQPVVGDRISAPQQDFGAADRQEVVHGWSFHQKGTAAISCPNYGNFSFSGRTRFASSVVLFWLLALFLLIFDTH